MNILNFINDLRTIDIIILVLVVLIFIFLVYLTSSLMKKNRELREELTSSNRTKSIEEDDLIIKKSKDDEELVEYVDDNENMYEDDDLEDLIIDKKEEDITEILEDLPELDEEPGPYKKNVLRELSARSQTSPVNIGNSTVDIPKVKVTSYVKEEKIVEPIKVNTKAKNERDAIKKIDEVDNKTFIEEISRRMEDELKPQTIELTDYERRQEEEAIISYKELIKVKDRIYRINDDEEIDTFIDELKDFRNDLE